MRTYQKQFGFILDLRDCEGKQIEKVEFISMEFGCTYKNAYAVSFTDKSRCFFLADTGGGIMNPAIEAVEKSNIFTTDEYIKMERDRVNEIKNRKLLSEKRKREELKRLKNELGEL